MLVWFATRQKTACCTRRLGCGTANELIGDIGSSGRGGFRRPSALQDHRGLTAGTDVRFGALPHRHPTAVQVRCDRGYAAAALGLGRSSEAPCTRSPSCRILLDARSPRSFRLSRMKRRHPGASDAHAKGEASTYCVALTAAACLALVGCPQTLGDDFSVGDPHSNSPNGGKSSRDPRTPQGGSSADLGGASSETAASGGESSAGRSEAGGTDPGMTGGAGAGASAQGGTSALSTSACRVVLGQPAPISFADSGISSTVGLTSPTLSSDGLTLYFVMAQAMSGLDQIYRATRETVDSLVFSGAQAVFATATEARGTPALSSDDLTLYFQATRWNGMGDRDLWFTKRSSVGAAFVDPQAVTAANTPAVEHHPFLTQDQLALYYVSLQYAGGYYPTSTNSNIWRVTRTSTDEAFADPTEVEELNSPYRDQRVAITSNGRVIYFATDRDDYLQLDLWTATRTTQRGTFEPPEPVTDAGVNSLSDDRDVALSPRETELFFVSNRDGRDWIYRSTRGCQ